MNEGNKVIYIELLEENSQGRLSRLSSKYICSYEVFVPQQSSHLVHWTIRTNLKLQHLLMIQQFSHKRAGWNCLLNSLEVLNVLNGVTFDTIEHPIEIFIHMHPWYTHCQLYNTS